MKNNLIKFFAAGAGLFVAMSSGAKNYTETSQSGFNDSDLNAALGISDAWIWLQNSIVPLAMLAIFLGVIIIMAELHYRQNKILGETLRNLAKTKDQNLESFYKQTSTRINRT
jgi:hypothetical protein